MQLNNNNSNASAPPSSSLFEKVKQSFSHRKKTWLIAGFLLAGAILAGIFFKIPLAKNSQNGVALAQPDVWVHSQNLSLLPRDLLQVPLLKTLLTEDFVYFYAEDEDWLSLQGAMRRISFEHALNWSDTLLKNIAEAPADIYMWHDDSHALRYWALSLERDQLSAVAQKLATLKLTADKQLQQIGSVRLGSESIPVLQLSLSPRRQMVLAAHQNRLVLLSDIDMVSHADNELDDQTAKLISRLLSEDAKVRAEVIAEWQVTANAQPVHKSKQTILVSNRLFAQGYAPFVPYLGALRFDFDGKQWQTQANIADNTFNPNIWRHLPANAAFCVATPIDWAQVQTALAGAKNLNTQLNLPAEFASSGAICWYAEKSDDIAQPLFVALRQPSQNKQEMLTALFDWGVATNQDHLKALIALNRQKRHLKNQLEYAASNLEAAKQEKIDSKLDREQKAARQAQKEAAIESSKAEVKAAETALAELAPAITAAKQAAEAPALIAKENAIVQQGGFTVVSRKLAIEATSEKNPVLAFDNEVVYFSTNPALIQRAVSVGEKKYPNLQESAVVLQQSTQQFLYVNPIKLSTLLTATGHAALPQETKSNLRAAFDYHMPARFAALSQQRPFSLVLESKASKTKQADSSAHDIAQWQPLVWRTAPER